MGEKGYIVGNHGDPLLGMSHGRFNFCLHNNFLNPKSKEAWSGTRKSRAFVAHRKVFNPLLRMQMQST